MTQPVQEPTTQRSISGLKWRTNQIERRPAPTSEGCRWCTTAAYMEDLVANGTGLNVANDNWENVVTGTGANQRWLNEFCDDPEGNWTRNFATGTINNNVGVAYAYAASGFVQFDVPDGTIIGAAIDWVSAENFANTGPVADNFPSMTVYSERVPISNGVRLMCYQNSGGTAEILAARLHVRRFEIFEDVWDCEFFS